MNILEYTNQDLYALVISETYNNFLEAISLKIDFENAKCYLEYYANKPNKIECLDDFIDYLFLWKQSLYINALPYIKDDKKEGFEQTYKRFENLFANYKLKDVISFVNNHYAQICANQVIALVSFLFIRNKQKGINKRVFIEYAQKQPFIWYRNLKYHIRYLSENKDIVEILFSKANFDKYVHGMYNLIFECLSILAKYPIFISVVEQNMQRIIDFMDSMEKEIKQENIFQYYFIFKDFCEYLHKAKHPEANDKIVKLKQYDMLLQKEIADNGHHFSFEIRGEDIEAHIGKVEPQYEVLQLTHIFDKERDGVIPVFENVMRSQDGQSLLVDTFRNNLPHNDYFTASKIERLQQAISLYIMVFNHYISKIGRQKFVFAYIKSIIDSICNKLGIDYLESGLSNDIEIIEAAFYNSFEIVSKKQVQEKQIILQLLCYSLISYICTFIEKLLREIFIKENQEQMFIDVSSLTLGDLLNIKNEVLIKILGYEQVRCLRYFLHMDNNEVGENIRNKFAHFNGVTPKDFQPNIVLKVLWLLLGIINSLTLHYLTSENDKNNTDAKD